MKRFSFIFIFLFLLLRMGGAVGFAAEPPTFRMSLAEAERLSLAHSPRAQAAQADLAAAEQRAKSQFAALWPRVSFDASFRYVSEVPSFQPLPTAPATKFGDHENYSVGPAVSWIAWDSGAVSSRWKSAEARLRSKRHDFSLAKRRLLLEARLDYFQVQLKLEQVRLLADSLKLAQSQYNDISVKQRAGALSRIDSLQAHEEELSRRRELRQAQADLATALDALFAVTGSTPPADASVPIESAIPFKTLGGIDPPTLLVELDALETNLSALAPAAEAPLNLEHPQITSLAELVQAATKNVRAARAGRGPTLLLTGKISRDYPNGPVLESFTQKTAAAALSWPLFEAGRAGADIDEQTQIALGAERQRAQALADLRRDWDNARGQWLGLASQQKINSQSIKETEELARLIYQSYQAGRSSILEVETANLRALESKIIAARTDAELLIQLAVLDSLSSKE